MTLKRRWIFMTVAFLGLLISWSAAAGREGKAPSMDKAKKEALARLDHLKDLSALLRAGEEPKQLAKSLKEYREDCRTLGLADLTSLTPETLEDMEGALKNLSKVIKRSVKLREYLLKAKSGRSFAHKAKRLSRQQRQGRVQGGLFFVQGAWTQTGTQWQEYAQMDREEFAEVQADLLEDWQWEVEIDEEDEVIVWIDDLASQETEISFSGRLVHTRQFGRHQAQIQVLFNALGQVKGQLQQLSNKQLGLKVRSLEKHELKKLRVKKGVIVRKVTDGGLAEDAGLRKGDVIIKVEDDRVESRAQFKKLLEEYEAEEAIVLTIVRKGKKKKITIDLEEAEIKQDFMKVVPIE